MKMNLAGLGLGALMVLGAASWVGCAPPPPAPPAPLKPKAELGRVRVLLAGQPQVTVTDGACDPWKPLYQATLLNDFRSSLSRAGFSVVSDPKKAHDTTATISARLSCSDGKFFTGTAFLALEPGAIVQGDYRNYWQMNVPADGCNESSSCTADQIVRQLAEAPQIIALTKAEPAADSAPTATVSPIAAPAPPPTEPAPASPAPPAFHAGAPQRNTFAVIIGVETYRDISVKATHARADAEHFAQLARATLGIPEDHMVVALDDRAGRADMAKHLDWARANVPKGGRILFYFSGHGAPDPSGGKSYLVPFDGDPRSLDGTALVMSSVLENLSKSPAAEVVALVDSCFSGAGGRSVLPPGARPLVRIREVKPAAHVALLTAASGSEISGPNAAGTGGLFSTLLIEGIGSGVADHDGDGNVSLQELADWVRPRVTRTAKQHANRDQTPQLIVGSGANASALMIASGLPSR